MPTPLIIINTNLSVCCATVFFNFILFLWHHLHPQIAKVPGLPKHKTYNVCPWNPAGGVSKQCFHSLRDGFMSMVKNKRNVPLGKWQCSGYFSSSTSKFRCWALDLYCQSTVQCVIICNFIYFGSIFPVLTNYLFLCQGIHKLRLDWNGKLCHLEEMDV